MLKSRLISDLPYSQKILLPKFNDLNRQKKEQDAHLEYLKLSSRLLSVADEYAASYDAAPVKTLLHFRDYLIATAIRLTLESVLYKDATASQLTEQAQQIYATNPYESFYFYNDDPADIGSRYAGLLGTPAYYFTFIEVDDYPLNYLTKLLTLIWSFVGLSYNDAPAVRITKLFRLIGLDRQNDTLIDEAITRLFAITNPDDEHYNALLQARRNCITIDDAKGFTDKVIKGIYPPALMPILADVLSERDYTKISGFVGNVRSILKPVGVNLLLQALIIEGYVKAARVINCTEQLDVTQSVNSFLTLNNNPLATTVRNSVANHLTTAYDALQYLTVNNVVDFAPSEYRRVIPLVYMWTTSDIPADAVERLSTLYETSPIDLNKVSNSALVSSSLAASPASDQPVSLLNDAYNQLNLLPAIGNDVVTLRGSDNYSDRVTYTANNLSSSVRPSVFFVSLSGVAPDADYEFTTSPATTTSGAPVVVVNIKNRSKEPLVVVATTSLAIPNGSTLSLEAYMGLRESILAGDTASVSDTAVAYPLPTLDSPTVLIDEKADQLLDYFYIYNQLTATTPPRGSIISRYQTQGVQVQTHSPSALQLSQFYTTRMDGGLEEYAGRMSGLLKQQTEVHVKSELRTVKDWAKSLRDIKPRRTDDDII